MTNPTAEYPGTQQHQSLIRHIVNYYHDDPRVLSIIVLGSVGRGNWDALSDLDLDVVVTDDAKVNVEDELRALSESFSPLGERSAIIFAEEVDEGEVVLESLMMLTIRYHPLANTNYSIVDSMRVLSGSLPHDTIAAAGIANRHEAHAPLTLLLDKLIRYAAIINVYYQRQFTWGVIEILHYMRGIIMQIFARTHDGVRSFHTFQALADPSLQAQLAQTLPGITPESMHMAFLAMLHLIENNLGDVSNGALALTPGQKVVIDRVRAAVA